jgi:3-dehydroquinate synthase
MLHTFDVTSVVRARWSTRVVVGAGILDRAATGIAKTYPDHRRVVVSDTRVGRLYGRAVLDRLARRGAPATLLTFPAGERFKTRDTKGRLEDRLLRLGAGRDTVVIALGGGVTGDLAGFLAATWYRGVPVVQIPTTTLAMLDAALGGKTGVDLPQGKNLVGAFHHPESIWADVEVLRTLPARIYTAGLAEAVKSAVAIDAALFGELERDTARLVAREPRALVRLVSRCLELKGRIVAKDEREAGRRAVLNFGHTAAHAIETATSYRTPHGEAVAIGQVAEARLAERLTGLPRAEVDRIEALLVALGLPVRPPRGLDPRRLRDAMRLDKKARGGVVRCALPEGLGRMAGGTAATVAVDPVRDLLPLLVRN